MVLEIAQNTDLIKRVHNSETFADCVMERKSIGTKMETAASILRAGLHTSHPELFQPIVAKTLSELEDNKHIYAIPNFIANNSVYQIYPIRQMLENPSTDFEKDMASNFSEARKQQLFNRTNVYTRHHGKSVASPTEPIEEPEDLAEEEVGEEPDDEEQNETK